MVTPHRKVPSSGSISPARIWNRVVFARELLPTKASLSPFLTIRSRSLKTCTPSTVLPSPFTSRMMSPHGRSGLNTTYGYLRDDTGMSSMVSFSRSFFLEVACFALEALEEKRCMNSFNSAALSWTFLLSSWRCFRFNWLAWYQKS